MVHINVLLADLMIRVTDASVEYVGSVTIHEELCDALGLFERQQVQIRNQETGVELWTYVIRGAKNQVPPGTLCLNGAAAHLVNIGDVVNVSAFGLLPLHAPPVVPRSWDAIKGGVADVASKIGKPDCRWANYVAIDYAAGKVHRPRVTAIKEGGDVQPTIHIDATWAKEAGVEPGETSHVVNVSNGQRDVMSVKYLPSGSKRCEIHMGAPFRHDTGGYGSRPGYQVGDTVIAMTYYSISREAVLHGNVPPMKISFPVEKPDESAAEFCRLSTMWDMATQVLWDGKTLADGLISTLSLKPGMKVLDCSCGSGFPGIDLVSAGIDIKMSDGSKDMVTLVKERAEVRLGPHKVKNIEIKHSNWDELTKTWGNEEFDVIIWRGNSLPYVATWKSSGTSSKDKSRDGYTKLVQSAKSIYDALKPGGTLYLDCIPASAENGAALKKHGTLPNGKPVEFEWTFSVDEAGMTRRWRSVATSGVNGTSEKIKTDITALLVREVELKSVLTYAGFGLVNKVKCPGEIFYQGYVAMKPRQTMKYYDRQIGRYHRVWNENGKICWGLCEGLWPVTGSEKLTAMSKIRGSGAMVGPNIALEEYMVSKYRDIEVSSLLDVGCGTGRSSINLAKQFPGASIVGCDPGTENIKRGKEMAKEEGVDNVSFFCGTVQEMVAGSGTSGSFNSAWSEAALCHAPPDGRAGAIQAISDQLDEGGIFVINDAIAGNNPVSPAAQLHSLERLGYTGLWNNREYMEIIEAAGFQVIEYVDLSCQQARSYSMLAAEAQRAADDAAAKDDKESEQVFATLARDYNISANIVLNGEWSWVLFVCKKRSAVASSATPSN